MFDASIENITTRTTNLNNISEGLTVSPYNLMAGTMIPNESMENINLRSNENSIIQMQGNFSGSQSLVSQTTGSQPIVQMYSNPFYWCDALMQLIEFEDKHGKLNTLIEYHSFSKENLVRLNYNIPSIYGEVDVDWMLRLAVVQYPFIIGSIISPSLAEGFGSIASRAAFIALKAFWIAIDPRTDKWNWDSLTEAGNWNASPVIVRWIHGQESLRDIFAPAIPICEGQPMAPPDTREPTY